MINLLQIMKLLTYKYAHASRNNTRNFPKPVSPVNALRLPTGGSFIRPILHPFDDQALLS